MNDTCLHLQSTNSVRHPHGRGCVGHVGQQAMAQDRKLLHLQYLFS